MKISDYDRLKKIINTWEKLNNEIEQRGITKDKLLNDEFMQWAITTPLYNIGEHTYNLSKEFKEQHPEQDKPYHRSQY